MTPETTKILQDTIELLNGVLFTNWRETAKEITRRAQTLLQQPPTPHNQVLVYHGKHGDEIYLANTPERLAAANQAIFAQLDHWGCYHFNQNDKDNLEKARAGDPQAIAHLLETHRHLEYEDWELIQAFDATQPQD